MATVTGGIGTIGGEKVLTATAVTVGDANALKPLGLPNRSLSTADSKLSTVGLLVTTWGKVVKSVDASGGAKYLYVDDGSMVPSDITGVYALKVGPVVTTAGEGDFVQATGIGRIADAG